MEFLADAQGHGSARSSLSLVHINDWWHLGRCAGPVILNGSVGLAIAGYYATEKMWGKYFRRQ